MAQMYKCQKCGHVFSEDEIPTYKDLCPTDRGTQVIYYSKDCCPYCYSGKYFEVYECPVCGEYESEDEGEPCEQCADDIDYYVANCIGDIIAWYPTIGIDDVGDYIESAIWRLTRKDTKYLKDVIASKTRGKK